MDCFFHEANFVVSEDGCEELALAFVLLAFGPEDSPTDCTCDEGAFIWCFGVVVWMLQRSLSYPVRDAMMKNTHLGVDMVDGTRISYDELKDGSA